MNASSSVNFGIQAMELYFPKTYVEQEELEIFDQVSPGKYTKGLGQHQLSFTYPFQDVNSMALTVVANLLRKRDIKPEKVGRLEVGTQTLVDKSKSTKTVLMDLFGSNHDIEGATSINACYGATNALINGMNWLTSTFWDGRYCIVVASDIALYEKGPARCTGGAGAVAILMGPNAKITFQTQKASFCKNVYDFFKPDPHSQYPTVIGKLSIESYLAAVQQCYTLLSQKRSTSNLFEEIDFFCFHSPFYKMVYKAFAKLMETQFCKVEPQIINESFMKKVHPCHFLSQKLGNIYTGSVFASLISLFITNPDVKNKKVCLFSYGSGLCSTMLLLNVKQNLLQSSEIKNICDRLQRRIKISPEEYDDLMLKRQLSYGKNQGKIYVQRQKLSDNTFYLSEIDAKKRRKYQYYTNSMQLKKNTLSSTVERIERLQKAIVNNDASKFYKLSIQQRRKIVNEKVLTSINDRMLDQGGLSMKLADSMTQNVIGMISLPLSIVPLFIINSKEYMIPMSIEEPSVVAACSSIGKLLAPYSFRTSSTHDMMIGQIHLPNSEKNQVHQILSFKKTLLEKTNAKCCLSMVERGGGIMDLKIRQLNGINSKQYSVDVYVNVCDAMGANLINTICQEIKIQISQMEIKTGIAILSNYCIERKALSWFEIPVKKMAWKENSGESVVEKIIEAYQFARSDHFRAVTHNKGIMNGIDAVCIATGQDWRAIQSSCHCYASRTGKYLPLSHYEVIHKDGLDYFKGSLEIPISVGTKGGAVQKNPLYAKTLEILGNPTSQELSEIIVSVGLAQNLAALRALAVEGIQKGHMSLHRRTNNIQAEVLTDQISPLEQILKPKL